MKRITLKNLHEATAQEVFDQVAIHLLTQKEKCLNGRDSCSYRFENLRCAAGCLIDDDEYMESMEGKSWSGLTQDDRYKITSSHYSLICELQNIHDSKIYEPEDWKEMLIDLTKRYNLNTNAIEKFQA